MNEPRPTGDLAAEGDVNLSPLRRAWEAAHVRAATRALLDARRATSSCTSRCRRPASTRSSPPRASGSTDVEGRRFMDFHGNNVHQVGYRHPHVIARCSEALDTLPFSPRRFTNEAAVDAGASGSAALAPDPLGKVLFAPGGTLAIGMALKLARVATGRHKTMSLWDSFHGASLDAISIGGEAVFRKRHGAAAARHRARAALRSRATAASAAAARCNARCAEYIDYVLGKEEDVAAVIIETVRCTDVQIPPPDYYRIVREACDRHGALLILDEVPIALGRTGTMFAFEHYGIVPDMVVLGKGLGGAVFPMAALIARRDLDVAADRALGHYTHEKSSVGCAAALATLEVIEDEAPARARARRSARARSPGCATLQPPPPAGRRRARHRPAARHRARRADGAPARRRGRAA